jgi:hypothetical protein
LRKRIQVHAGHAARANDLHKFAFGQIHISIHLIIFSKNARNMR